MEEFERKAQEKLEAEENDFKELKFEVLAQITETATDGNDWKARTQHFTRKREVHTISPFIGSREPKCDWPAARRTERSGRAVARSTAN
jgi:hypothetical protein